jgi:tetratricopeptide (TPR) repeat protein
MQPADLAQRLGENANLVRAASGNTRRMQSETGSDDEARIAVLDSALGIVGKADSPERARLLAMRAAELMYSREWERRVQLSDEALAIAQRLEDADALSTVLNMRFVTLLAPETLDERRENTVEAVAAAAHQRDRLVQFYAYHWRGYACIEAGDVEGARSWFGREQALADQFRQPTTVWLRLADEANLAIIRGDLEQADQLSKRALTVGSGSEPAAERCFAAQQTSIAFELGSMGELVPHLEQAVNDNPGVPGFRATLALALVQASRFDEAHTLLEPAVATSFRDLPYDVTWLAVACIYAQVSCELGNVRGARALYRMLEPWSSQIAFPAFGVWGPVSLHLGSLALTLGDRGSARQHLNQAARAAIRAGAQNWEARANTKLDVAYESGS